MSKTASSCKTQDDGRPPAIKDYGKELAGLGLTEEEQRDVLETLHRIVQHFVDLAFDSAKPCGKPSDVAIKSGFSNRLPVK